MKRFRVWLLAVATTPLLIVGGCPVTQDIIERITELFDLPGLTA